MSESPQTVRWKGIVMRRRCFLVSFAAAIAVSVVGCGKAPKGGPETVKVSGAVTLDGEPVAGAHVTFSPKTAGPPAFGMTDEQGRFSLQTFEPGDGAIAGKYLVTVTKTTSQGGMEFEDQAAKEEYLRKHGGEGAQVKVVNQIPDRYSDRKKSGLTAEISMGTKNHVDLELKSK